MPTSPDPQPLVSVIVPAFNAAQTIAETLATALAQTYAKLEIVVVDDGSTDATAARVREVGARDARVRLIASANGGAAAARNRALADAVGPIVAPLDADDLWRTDYLARQLEALAAAPPDTGFVYALHRTIDPAGRVMRDFTDYGCRGHVFLQHMLVNFVGNGSAAVFRREAIDEVGGYDERRAADWSAEDYLLQLEVAARRPVAANPAYLVGYRKHPGSNSANPGKVYRSRIRAFDQSAEGRAIPAYLARWVQADAALVLAAQSLQLGDVWDAGAYLARGLSQDPVHAIEELGRRVAHRLPGGGDRAIPEAVGRHFIEADDTRPAPLQPPPRLARRLAQLAQIDEVGGAPRAQ